MKRLARWRKEAKVILLGPVALFERACKIIMGNVNYFLVNLDLKSQQ
jgi:hypothetical protein